MRRSSIRLLPAVIGSLGMGTCLVFCGCADEAAVTDTGDILTVEEVEAAQMRVQQQADMDLLGSSSSGVGSFGSEETDVMAPLRELAAEEAAQGPVESASRTGGLPDGITR